MATSLLENIRISGESPLNHPTEALVLFRFEEASDLSSTETALDAKMGGQIQKSLDGGDFKGKAHEILMLYAGEDLAAKRIFLVGLGKLEKFSLETIRTAAATAARKIQEMGFKDFSVLLSSIGAGHLELDASTREYVVGTELSLYKFTELKSKKENETALETVWLLADAAGDLDTLKQAVETGKHMAAGVYLTRDLVNWPSNFATPGFLAEQAQVLASDLSLNVSVYDEDKLKELGMGAFLSVAQGSDEPAKFIILEHNAGNETLDTIVLIGKGVTFDSGGVSLKPADGMERMKSDMAGAAAVLGAIKSAALMKVPLHVVVLVPCTENMMSGKAYKPADVVRAMNGKTIEVINTDAEGRMLLADSLCFAAQYQPKAVVDIATLTGARIVALGDHAIGLFSNSDALSSKLEHAGQVTYERVWRMPLFDEYREQLNSYVADIKHAGGRPGGSITAAKFLQEFVEGYDWVHLDIAGLVSNEKNKFYTPGWATGIGARLLTQFLVEWC
jgi:leucyl aminopeptidase